MMRPTGSTEPESAGDYPDSNHQNGQEEPAMLYVSEHVRWEYRLLIGSGKDTSQLERELNELGKKGWELTAVSGQSGAETCYFKRPQT